MKALGLTLAALIVAHAALHHHHGQRTAEAKRKWQGWFASHQSEIDATMIASDWFRSHPNGGGV